MNYDQEDINEKALYILKENENGRFETDYLKIDDELKNELEVDKLFDLLDKSYPWDQEQAQALFDEKQDEIMSFFEKVYVSHPYLFGYRNYSNRLALRSSYCEYKGLSNPDDISRIEKLDRNYLGLYLNKFPLITLAKDYIKDFIHSYNIEQAYNKCKSQPDIKAFSHRKVGWITYHYILNDIMSVNIDTNFGYGYSSYFLITLIYDNILIIPYSRLVIYHYAGSSELLRHTKEFQIDDRSWHVALNYIKNACNDLLDKGKESFVAKYMIEECEVLTERLPTFLEKTTFTLSDNFYGYDGEKKTSSTIELKGIDIIVFRAEKVAGAISYVENIERMNKLFPTAKYINIINSCCKKIEPMLDKEFIIQNENLNKLKETYLNLSKKIDDLNIVLSPIKEKYEEYNKIKNEKWHEIYDLKREDPEYVFSQKEISDLAEKEMTSNYNDYLNIIEEKKQLEDKIKELSKEHDKLYGEKWRLEDKINTLNKHASIITSHLEKIHL